MRTAALYVGLFGILLIVLSLRVSFVRRDARVALGDGDNELLRRRIRAHSNFVEFVPIALLLLMLAEHTGLGSLLIHLFGIRGALVAIGLMTPAVAALTWSRLVRVDEGLGRVSDVSVDSMLIS